MKILTGFVGNWQVSVERSLSQSLGQTDGQADWQQGQKKTAALPRGSLKHDHVHRCATKHQI